jgi:hypothetical protein
MSDWDDMDVALEPTAAPTRSNDVLDVYAAAIADGADDGLLDLDVVADWWPQRLQFVPPRFRCLLVAPIIGALYAAAAWDLRQRRGWRFNERDWVPIFVSGVALQLSIFGPLYCLARPQLRDHNPADWYGIVLTTPCAWLYFAGMAHSFMRRARRGEARGFHRRALPAVLADLQQIRHRALVRSELIVAAAVAIAGVEGFLLRVLARHLEFHVNGAVFWWVSTSYWFMQLISTHTMTYLGLVLLYQHVAMVKTFCGDEWARTRALARIYEQGIVAQWTGVWQGLVHEMQHAPLARAAGVGGAALMLAQSAACLWYLAVIRLYPGESAPGRDLQAAAVLGFAHSFILAGLYVFQTVRLLRHIEEQQRAMGETQNRLQCAVDGFDAGERPEGELELLQGRARLVGGLARLLAVADTQPRLMNMSLDSLRWTAINGGLVCINLFFLQLFIQFCLPWNIF